ncbi:hypothetical protein CDAR_181851, partial [Caerostris darwini]
RIAGTKGHLLNNNGIALENDAVLMVLPLFWSSLPQRCTRSKISIAAVVNSNTPEEALKICYGLNALSVSYLVSLLTWHVKRKNRMPGTKGHLLNNTGIALENDAVLMVVPLL